MNEIRTQSIRLERIDFCVEHWIAKHESDLVFESHIDFLTQNFVLKFKKHVWAEPPKHVDVEWPRDWWEAFKQRWFSKSLLKKFPVKIITRRVEFRVIYPNYKPCIPNEKNNITVNVFDQDWGRR